jgi:cell division protein FtsL
MPAIQNEYDDYSYIAMRRGTAKAAPRVADSKKRATQATRSTARPRPTNVSTSRMAAAKNANRESVRAVMRENSKPIATKTNTQRRKSSTTTTKKVSNVQRTTTTRTTAKRKATHNLEVPNINRKTQTSKVAKPKEMSLKKAELMNSPKQKANQKVLKKDNVLKNTAAFLCAFSVLLLICYRSSVINESFQALGALKAELEDTYTLNAQIESDIQTQTDLSNIETYAKYQLGMQKPKESQIQRIYVEKEDRISIPIVIEEEEDTLFESLMDEFLKLID